VNNHRRTRTGNHQREVATGAGARCASSGSLSSSGIVGFKRYQCLAWRSHSLVALPSTRRIPSLGHLAPTPSAPSWSCFRGDNSRWVSKNRYHWRGHSCGSTFRRSHFHNPFRAAGGASVNFRGQIPTTEYTEAGLRRTRKVVVEMRPSDKKPLSVHLPRCGRFEHRHRYGCGCAMHLLRSELELLSRR